MKARVRRAKMIREHFWENSLWYQHQVTVAWNQREKGVPDMSNGKDCKILSSWQCGPGVLILFLSL